jgi:hypothetical protein
MGPRWIAVLTLSATLSGCAGAWNPAPATTIVDGVGVPVFYRICAPSEDCSASSLLIPQIGEFDRSACVSVEKVGELIAFRSPSEHGIPYTAIRAIVGTPPNVAIAARAESTCQGQSIEWVRFDIVTASDTTTIPPARRNRNGDRYG